jgi:ureidoacrylate peracid hydrolase
MSVDVFSSHMHAERIALDPKRAAVVVVDMINEFCKPGGKMVLPGYETLRRSSGCMTATVAICGAIANS